MLVVVFIVMSPFPWSKRAACDEKVVLLREEFIDLEQWTPLFFPAIARHSLYKVVLLEDKKVLLAKSNGSASGIVFKKRFDVYDFPRMRWSWRIENVYEKGDVTRKEGDDYPIRIYVIFRYDPARVTLWERMKYKAARLVYGEYPPDSTINYIWANRPHKQRIITSSYSDRARMVILEYGAERAGVWVEEDVNILEDYVRAFGTTPPRQASIAIMNDSDDTGEESTSYVDFIEIYRLEGR